MMTLDAAREQLGFHCGADPRIHDPRWENGFLATLRPYCGLRLDVMANVDDCVRAVSEHLKEGQCLDRAIIGSLWAIVHYGRVAAEDIAARLPNWKQIYGAFERFSHCDDGAIAEGFTESVVHLLAAHWETLPQVASFERKNAAFRNFVLRHIRHRRHL